MGGDEFDARQGVDSSAHLKLEKDTVLTAGTASRRGTRLSSMGILEQTTASTPRAGRSTRHALGVKLYFNSLSLLLPCELPPSHPVRSQLQCLNSISRPKPYQNAWFLLSFILSSWAIPSWFSR